MLLQVRNKQQVEHDYIAIATKLYIRMFTSLDYKLTKLLRAFLAQKNCIQYMFDHLQQKN